MKEDFTILVNSTDSYEDCWNPFFKLYQAYMPADFRGQLLLNTEHKQFSFEGLDIQCTQIGDHPNGQRLTWSESLKEALSKTDTPLVLLILDDLFLDRPADLEKTRQIAARMLEHDYDCVYLTDQTTDGPFGEKDDLLWALGKDARYKVSALIALWNKKSLLKILRMHENPWQFEIYGTKRAQLTHGKYYSVNPERYNREGEAIISHCYPTGITRGKWNREAVTDLFRQHEIDLDFEKRGYYVHQKRSLIQKAQRQLSLKRLKSNATSALEIRKSAMFKGRS